MSVGLAFLDVEVCATGGVPYGQLGVGAHTKLIVPGWFKDMVDLGFIVSTQLAWQQIATHNHPALCETTQLPTHPFTELCRNHLPHVVYMYEWG